MSKTTRQILITGGAQRLGAQLVRAFATDGWSVWCHYQRSKAAALELAASLTDAKHPLQLVHANLAEPRDVGDMMNFIEEKSGALTAVVNNASLFEPDTGIDIALSGARAQMEVNLFTPMYLGQCLARQQERANRSDGCVIHILDQKVFNLNPDYFSYTLTKLALERAVALQAQSLAPRIRVCGVAPGLMYVSGPQEPRNFELASRVNLRQTATDPRDVAKTCVFLATTPSITGATLF